jgi:hypothetical protein
MTFERPNAYRGSLERLHVAMAEILSYPDWWALPEGQTAGIGHNAVRGTLPVGKIIEEFRALRRERGLPEVRE